MAGVAVNFRVRPGRALFLAFVAAAYGFLLLPLVIVVLASFNSGELLTFPLEFLLSNLPWSAVTLLTLRPTFARVWDQRGRLLLQLFLCWTWANLLFWAVVPGHRQVVAAVARHE